MHSLRSPSRLSRPEQWALLGAVGVGLIADLLLRGATGFDTPVALSQTLLTLVILAFAISAWNSPIFVIVLLILTVASSTVDAQQEAILALALGSGIVVRTGGALLQIAYPIVFLVSATTIHLVFPKEEPLSSFLAAIIVAAGSSVVGLLLRFLVNREMTSRRRLILEERARAEVTSEERRRIADDLHDIVAHDLTVIAMHARLLEHGGDADSRSRSHRAIVDSARQALADLRRVVQVASEGGEGGESHATPTYQRGVVAAVGELRDELTAAGYRVQFDSGIDDESSLDRLASGALARISREAGTNILKHATGAQRVTIRLHRSPVELTLSIWNSLPNHRIDTDLTSGGYGIARMSERAALLGGSFEARPQSGGWQVDARFPAT